MLHRTTLGKFPPKPHTAFYDESGKLLMEQCMTTEGFNGPFTILYFRTPPTDEFQAEDLQLPDFCPHNIVDHQPLHRRHIRSQDMKAAGDFLTGRKTLFVNADVQIGAVKPNAAAERFFSNGDGDELYFITHGQGHLESVYGILPFREHDYVLVPKSTAYRLHFEGNKGTALVFEGRPHLGIPGQYRNKFGQLTDYAPYSHRDFRSPTELLQFEAGQHGNGPYEIVVKMSDMLNVHRYKHFPLDVVGWDGCIYPTAFNIHDYQPITGMIHQPPTIHTTFAGSGFVVCSFVPRVVDFHEKSIPCPYGHASVDMDEIMYYVGGDFTSRKGITPESLSLHPQGVPHGPHPGTYEASIGATRTEELAVMCDTYKPLRMTQFADSLEDKGYNTSWVDREGKSSWSE
ncbi:MAG: homogentisate 1,2-dioxygenase [Phycisphaerae bacterium]